MEPIQYRSLNKIKPDQPLDFGSHKILSKDNLKIRINGIGFDKPVSNSFVIPPDTVIELIGDANQTFWVNGSIGKFNHRFINQIQTTQCA